MKCSIGARGKTGIITGPIVPREIGAGGGDHVHVDIVRPLLGRLSSAAFCHNLSGKIRNITHLVPKGRDLNTRAPRITTIKRSAKTHLILLARGCFGGAVPTHPSY